jgi:hypothetical protein
VDEALKQAPSGVLFLCAGFTQTESPHIETVEKKSPKPIDKQPPMMYNHYRKQSNDRE